MIEFKRSLISEKYHSIQILECPTDVILFAARLGSEMVTVENYNHYRNPNSLSIRIHNGNSTLTPKLKQFTADFQISKSDFISLEKIWDTQGCFAVFHESEEIRFKLTDLNQIARYKRLDNFRWTLEIAIPDSASGGWGQISSPQKNTIDAIEKYLQDRI
ncbi:hypothetical protein SAMN03080617_00360 [Algoriphagus alkaliphilus]|uniref:Uncharacterized protein n=1 Tax=Algoriphagus alkaliphilus TaxID=279824 RepID=A0A1G5VBD0_9BACT|nr:hypothetical protein [Algoriphagus alkaliphilus]SDA42325.1 hypothetical protein SAMN03080617_00360 [Algoriphagus alkaliphilus]